MNQSKENYIRSFLDTASTAYYAGSPIISDEQFDYLEKFIKYETIGASSTQNTVPHLYKMYSLQKYYKGEGKVPLLDYTKPKVQTPKLDGAALSILYINEQLTRVLTRGDGKEGVDVSDKFIGSSIIPQKIHLPGMVQITGELVTFISTPNARNYAAGALNLKSVEEFNTRELVFVAYSISNATKYYSDDLKMLETNGFKSVLDDTFCSNFPQDGVVIRMDSNDDYTEYGYTAKHPRGAFAIKERKLGVPTVLRDVVWQTGKSGKVTPIAIFDPVNLNGAIVSKATLNNVGFIKAMQLDIGDTIEVARAGEIIPQVLGKVWD